MGPNCTFFQLDPTATLQIATPPNQIGPLCGGTLVTVIPDSYCHTRQRLVLTCAPSPLLPTAQMCLAPLGYTPPTLSNLANTRGPS